MKGTADARALCLFKGFIGPNGSGKTWLGMAVANAASNRQIRMRINWSDETLTQGAVICETIKQLQTRMRKPGKNIICWDGAKNYPMELAFKIMMMEAMNAGGWLCFADEFPAYAGDKNKPIVPNTFQHDLTTRHYHFRTSFLWTASRMVNLHPEWRSQSLQKYIFHSPNALDRKTAAQEVGNDLMNALKVKVRTEDYSYILADRRKEPVIMPPWPAKKPYKMGK